MDIRFNQLEMLHLLWVVLALAGLAWWGLRRRRIALRTFATAPLLRRLAPGASAVRPAIKAALVLAALVALVAALVDPRWGKQYQEVQRRGIDIVFVVDVSRSMLADDVAPNRLERAKQYVTDIVDRTAGDRIGLVAFAGTANIKCPLTLNDRAFKISLEELSAEAAPRGGSLLGDAVRLAGESFVDDVRDAKAIVVLTDGEDHESFPVEAAEKINEATGARIFTVGIGDPVGGSRIPLAEGGSLTFNGEEVVTTMQPEVLRQVALAGGGAFIPAETSNADMGEVYEQRIATIAEREYEASRVRTYRARFQWFAGLAFALLLLEVVVADARRTPAEGRVG